MFLLTRSQLDHFQLNTRSLQLHATKLKQDSFKTYVTQFMEPFQVNLQMAELKLEIFDKTTNTDLICTDFKIYEDVLHHIVKNAIKFSKAGQKITIEVEYN